MRTALLACGAVICCCAVLAWQPPALRGPRAPGSTDRTQGRQDRQPDPRPPRAAAPEGEPPARRAPRATTRATCCGPTSSATPRATARRWRPACAATPARDWVGENIAAVSGRRGTRAARPCGCGWPRRRTAPCCCRRPGAASASASARARLGSARLAVFTADLASRALTGPRGGPTSLRRGDELDRPRVPGADARPADRVAADAERDLAHRLRAVRGGRGARVAGLVLPRRARVHRRLGLRHARRPLLAHVGQGHAVRRLPGLDAGPHRGGGRADRRRVPLLRPRRRPRGRRGRASPSSPR